MGAGGLDVAEFKRRQRLHRNAEIQAMRDVAEFIEKAHAIYGYDHFINDAGGSVAERIALVQEIWDSIAEEVERSPLTAAQRDEVDRRLATDRDNPQAAIPWEQVEAEALARLHYLRTDATGLPRSMSSPDEAR